MKKSFIAVVIFCVFAVMPSSGFAADEGKAPAKCSPVTVELLRSGRTSAELLVTSTPSLEYKIKIDYVYRGEKILEEKTYSVGKDGEIISFFLDSDKLDKSSGNIVVSTHSTGTDATPPTDVCSNEHNKENDTAIFIKAWSRHTARFDAGAVNTLNADGSWQSKPEVSASFKSIWSDWFTGGTDVRYSNYGEIKKKDAAVTGKTTGTVSTTTDNNGQATTTTNSTTVTPPKSGATQLKNPFESGGGTFQVNLYGYATPFSKFPSWAFIRPIVGFGWTSVPSQNDGASTDGKPLYYGGLRFDVDEFGSTIGNGWLSRSNGFVQAGILYNSVWEKALPTKYTTDRYFIEGELNVISITDANSLRLRLYVDTPREGNDPSDIRISALWAIDPIKLGWFFHPAGSTQTAAATKP
jgi:hypothetical protein